MTAWSSWATSTTKQNRIYQFFRKRFNQRRLHFCSSILLAIDLLCHVFPFEKLLLNVRLCKRHFWWRQIWRHLRVTILQCWAKFSNVLVRWSIRMVHAKNYKTMSKFVKAMTKNTVASFFRTRCIQELQTTCHVSAQGSRRGQAFESRYECLITANN